MSALTRRLVIYSAFELLARRDRWVSEHELLRDIRCELRHPMAPGTLRKYLSDQLERGYVEQKPSEREIEELKRKGSKAVIRMYRLTEKGKGRHERLTKSTSL